MENKYTAPAGNNSLYILGILGIVGVVAVVGMVMLFGQGAAAGDSDSEISGEAILSANNALVKNDVFLLKVGVIAPTTTSTVGELLQYKGADKITSANPKIRFKLLSLGESLEYAIPVNKVDKQPEFNIHLGGKEFKVKLLKPKQVDSPIQIDFNGDGVVETSPNKVNLFNGYSPGIKGLGYTCTEVVTLQEGEKITLKDDSELKLIYLDATNVKVDLLKIWKQPSGLQEYVQKYVPQIIPLGETWEAGSYNIHPINVFYQAYAGGIHQATFCVNY